MSADGKYRGPIEPSWMALMSSRHKRFRDRGMKDWALTRLTRRGKTTFTLVVKGQVIVPSPNVYAPHTGLHLMNDDGIPFVEMEVTKETLLALRDGLMNSHALNEEE